MQTTKQKVERLLKKPPDSYPLNGVAIHQMATNFLISRTDIDDTLSIEVESGNSSSSRRQNKRTATFLEHGNIRIAVLPCVTGRN